MSDKPYTCSLCGGVRRDFLFSISMHEPMACPVMVADMPPASSPAHDPLACTCCQIAFAATKERDARAQADLQNVERRWAGVLSDVLADFAFGRDPYQTLRRHSIDPATLAGEGDE